MIRVGIVGATGYGGRELLRLLGPHPEVELDAIASTTAENERLADVLPAFDGLGELRFEHFDAERLAERCDVVFTAVPSTLSMEPVAALRRAGVRVIDLGPDFRLQDPQRYEQYYGVEHTAPERLAEAVYGLVPWLRDALPDAQLVAVPGCYPISALLPLRPLVGAPMAGVPVVIDAISGISGAGRAVNEGFHFPEMNENLRAYKLAVHQHVPEIEQELLDEIVVQFTPHVAPITRGILTTITVRPRELFDPAPYFARYADEPFVRVWGEGRLPEVRYVRGSNFCDIGWRTDARTGNILLVSAIDNLMGGTAGMAIQCMNLMFDIPETTGLQFAAMAP